MICIKLSRAKSAPNRQMDTKCVFALPLLLVLAPGAFADSDNDAVNERIPVAGAQLEEHWQVDCEGVRASLLAVGTSPGTGKDCPITTELQRALQLCAFIYQPPGGRARRDCPDYQAVATALEKAGTCEQLATAIRSHLHCSGLTP